MLAARLLGILPALTARERLEISVIESLSSKRGWVRLSSPAFMSARIFG
jgi:predicted ATPase with chaperone activity